MVLTGPHGRCGPRGGEDSDVAERLSFHYFSSRGLQFPVPWKLLRSLLSPSHGRVSTCVSVSPCPNLPLLSPVWVPKSRKISS